MLELSSYDDIPHLLAPVVTDPGKAIRALKWTVEQMEERYRMMANVASGRFRASMPRSARLAPRAPARAEGPDRFDADSGQPVYETEQLEYEALPQIVVVVDELADLMMTAGKEVDSSSSGWRRRRARRAFTSSWRPSARRSTSSPG